MVNSILIGKLIYERLSNNKDIKKYVDSKIFPLIAEAETTFPYIAYTKDSITAAYSKDGVYEDSVSVQVIVASIDYLQSLEIANLVRQTFESKRFECAQMTVSDIRLFSVTESYDDNAGAFIQRLIFNFKVQ